MYYVYYLKNILENIHPVLKKPQQTHYSKPMDSIRLMVCGWVFVRHLLPRSGHKTNKHIHAKTGAQRSGMEMALSSRWPPGPLEVNYDSPFHRTHTLCVFLCHVSGRKKRGTFPENGKATCVYPNKAKIIDLFANSRIVNVFA